MRRVAWPTLLLFVIGGPALAQVKRPKPIPYTPKKLDEYTAYCALWRTDATFRSTVRLKNSLETSPIDATVTLYMADGTPYVLPPVHLAKSGVGTVEVNAVLAQAPRSIQEHLSSFGSASVKYRYDWQGVVLASMSILDTARSLEYMPSFVFPAKPAPADQGTAPPTQAYEGLWWRYGDSSAGFVALANTTDEPIGVEVGVYGLKTPAGRSLVLAAHGASMLDLKDFFAGDTGRVGGLHITYSGTWGAVQVAGGLEDPVKGFSVDMPVAWRLPPTDTAGPRQVAAAGMMVNHQDPLLNFPEFVSFTPYAFFRNIAATPKTLHFGVYYMEGRTVKSLPLADLALQPGEARELPIGNLMRSRTQIEAINLSFSYDGYWGDILAGIGSVDQTGNYVFPVVPAAVYKGGSRMSPYWLAEGGFDTMYTLWNPEPYAQELLVTLKYGANGESYNLPVTLESHASAMIDIGELIRTQQLDQDGSILRPDVKHGSLLVSSPANEPEDAIDVVVGMGIYNPRKATCGGGCITCNGWVSMFMGPGGWVNFPTGDTQQFDCSYNDNYGWQHNVSGWSNWTSSASQVIAVQTAGQSNPGLASAESPGTAEIDAFDPVPLSVYINQMCTNGTPPVCPTSNIGCTGGGTVVQLTCNGYSNSITVTRGSNVSCTVSGAQTSQVTGWGFAGEGQTINGPTGVSTWSGTMVVGGNITVTAAGQALSLAVTVNPRTNFPQVAMPSPQLVANGSMVGSQRLATLSSPPTTDEGSMGQAAYGWGYTATWPSVQSGPNQGLFYVTGLSDTSAYGWELNPGLTNSSDPFYQHQGNCYASVSQIVAAVQAHEVGMPGPSHYSEVQAALAANNPGTVAEAAVGGTQAGIKGQIDSAYQSAFDAGTVEPPGNLSTLRINYPPYQSCP